jgi:two-component system, chemotaxis family, chemotaxis protein CheY
MAAKFERLRFLVVDDNSHMISVVKTILRGFEAKVMFDAQDAADAFDRIRHDMIDIVITDYHMEILDGVEFVHMVRKSSDSPNPYVPIIMLTAHTERSKVMAARDAGVTEFCAKPVTALGLYDKIRAVIDNPRPFVKTPTYFGPDRRRRQSAEYRGPERRGVARTLDDAAGQPSQPAPAAAISSAAEEEDLWSSMT